MKKSIFVLSILLPAIAHGASSDKLATATPSPTPEENTSAAVVKKDETKKEETPKKLEQTVKLQNTCDLEDGGVTLSLTDSHFKLSGTMSATCLDRLSLDRVEHFDPAKSIETDEVNVEKTEELKEYSATVQGSVSFTSDEKYPTLQKCKELTKDEEQVDLSSFSRFSRKVTTSPEVSIGGLIGEPMDLKSPEYIKMEQKIAGLQCKNCNADWSKIKSRIKDAKGFDSPLIAALVQKLFADAMASELEKIKTASFADLTKIRARLREMKEFAITQDQQNALKALVAETGRRNSELATAPDHKRYNATAHADFAMNTFKELSEMPGVSAEEKADYKKQAAEFAPGQPARVDFISQIDGMHPEVVAAVKASDRNLKNLEFKAQMACMSRDFTRCGEFSKQLQASKDDAAILQSRNTLAMNDGVMRMKTYWDAHHFAYDQALIPSLTQPVKPITSNLPTMYDPYDPKYKNFDPSKMYQPSGIAPESLPFYSEQPYSIVPVNS